MKVRMHVCTAIILMIGVLWLVGASPVAATTWPLDNEWVPALTRNWDEISDAEGDMGTAHLDVIDDPVSGSAFSWFFDGTNLFFRLVLRGDPVDGTRLANGSWMVYIESTGDNYPDYGIHVHRSGQASLIKTVYNTQNNFSMEGDTDPTHQASSTVKTVVDGYSYLADGYVRSKPFAGVYYLEFYVPLSWLQRPGNPTPPSIQSDTVVKFAAGTSQAAGNANNINGDLVDPTAPGSLDLGGYLDDVAAPTTLGGGPDGYGVLRDTRHDTTIANSGTWNPGETVTVEGYGWPPETSTYYNDGLLPVRIVAPDASVVWAGSVNTTTDGTILPTPIWPVPISARSGVYVIQAESPLTADLFVDKDTFTVQGLAFAASTKYVDQTTALRGETLTYTIEIPNDSPDPLTLTVTDPLPITTDYVAGTTKLNGAPVVESNGFPLQSGYEVVVPGHATLELEFQVVVKALDDLGDPISNGDEIVNTVSISDGIYTLTSSAVTTVQAPELEIIKTENSATGSVTPGSEVTFTTSITNIGQAAALNMRIVDIVPEWTSFLAATGPLGSVVEYQDPDGNWHADANELEVTAVRWSNLSLAAYLPPDVAPSLSLTLMVRIK